MPTKPYAIFHTAKVKTPGMATSATQHNYRLELTPNADPDWGGLNEEYLNHEQRNYWLLATERIAELQLPRLRGDAVHLVEVLLTASPEAFERDEQGRSQDVRKTSWVQDNLTFMQQRFGKENVVGFMLHQDEITPHIHVMVVPITADGRLSCRDVFSPATLRQLQTDYAAAMEKHGLQRGILYSTAQHEDVRRHYGAQQMSKEKLAEVAAPVKTTTFQLDTPKPWERVRPQEYVVREQTRLDAYIAQLVAEANRKLSQVATVATANTLEGERAKALQKQLARSQDWLISTREELSTTKTQLQQQQELTTKTQLHHRQAVTRHLQNDPLPEALVTLARNQRARQLREVNQVLAKHLCPPLRELTDLAAPLLAKGYGLKVIGPQEVIITHQRERTRFSTVDLQPNGRPLLEQFQQVVAQTNRQIPSRDRDNGIEM
ncbi:MAG: MobV family relaxase [Janthinobacterium lividum]